MPSTSTHERSARIELARDYRQTPAPLRRRGEVCIVEGFGIRIAVERGQLKVSDGAGRNRRERRYGRANHGLSRLVVIGAAGSVSLAALRWLADLGISFLHLDRDGRLLTHSAAITVDDARLRRAQALATCTPTGVEVARYLLGEKIQGQEQLLGRLGAQSDARDAMAAYSGQLGSASSLDEMLAAEREAALVYWGAWRPLQLQFRSGDTRQLPEHWHRFGQRHSPLTSAPRLAINPANALLNYLYAIVEAETRIACLTAGLDPGLGVVHADYRSRDSLALDLMEAVRHHVDAYVLELVAGRVFRAADFHETRKGSCRILAPLSHTLAETAPAWGALIAPVVERVVQILAQAPGTRIDRLATPLTNSNRHAGRERMRRAPAPPSAWTPPKPAVVCRRCGSPVPRPQRVYCDDCLPHYQREQYAKAFHGSGLNAIEKRKKQGDDPTHGADAALARAGTNVQRKREVREWDQKYGKLTDLSAFGRDILPAIQGVPLSRLQQATGLSLRYVSLIRRGEKTPHPRHWQRLLDAAAS